MNDIYSTIDKLTADLIEAVYPAEDEGEISPVSLKCEIVKGDVTYYVTNKRNSKGNYESNISADTEEELEEAKDIDFVPDREINLATARVIREALSDPDTLENIKDGTITTKALINSILSTLEPEGITSPVDMAIKTLQMSQKETANQRNAENKAIEELDKSKNTFSLGKDYEVAIAKFISGYLSRPQTIRDILDGKETAGSSISKAVDIFNS